VALGRSRLGIVRPDNFAEGNGERWRLRFLGQRHQLLRSTLLACYANGLTGTVAANDQSPLLELPNQARIRWELAMASSRVTAEPSGTSALVAPLQRTDLPEADRIFRVAFGTFLRLPNPSEFAGDADFVRTRWAADQSAAFGAYLGKDLVGSNFATRWGRVAFFGPRLLLYQVWRGEIRSSFGSVVRCLRNSGLGQTAIAHDRRR
jgi:hypothetical protein